MPFYSTGGFARGSNVDNEGSLLRNVSAPSVDATGGAVTRTASELLGGIIRRLPEGGQTDVLPTVDLITTELNNRGIIPVNGTAFDCLVTNEDDADAVTFTLGDDMVTVGGATISVATAEAMWLHFQYTDVTDVAAQMIVVGTLALND